MVKGLRCPTYCSPLALLFSMGASQDQMTYLSWALVWFEAISRLRINLDKS